MTAERTCALAPFVSPVVAQIGSLEQAGSALEILTQSLEGYLALLRQAVCDDLTEIVEDCCGGGPGDLSFLDLTDTPSTYVSQGGNMVIVNPSETGLIFSPVPTDLDVRTFTTNNLSLTTWWPATGTPFMGAAGINAVQIEVGTGSFQLPVSGSTLSSRSRARYTSGAAANSVAAIRNSGNLVVRRGDAAGEGGFRLCIRVGVETTVANTRFFCGLSATIAFGNVTLTSRVNVIGFGWDAAIDTEAQILHNDGAGNINRVPLGASFPANDGISLYDIQIEHQPNATGFTYRVTRVNDGSVATGSVTTELPAATQGLTPYFWLHNGGTAAAVQLSPSALVLNNYE